MTSLGTEVSAVACLCHLALIWHVAWHATVKRQNFFFALQVVSMGLVFSYLRKILALERYGELEVRVSERREGLLQMRQFVCL